MSLFTRCAPLYIHGVSDARRVLDNSELEKLIELAVKCQLADDERRKLLLKALPIKLATSLERQSSPLDQLRSDIFQLAQWPAYNGSKDVPLAVWVSQARRMLKDARDARAEQFEEYIKPIRDGAEDVPTPDVQQWVPSPPLAPDGQGRRPEIDEKHPFPLLEPYRDEALFAGRETETERMLTVLAGSAPVIGLYAPSGHGKSSLLSAGLMPRLRQARRPVAFDRQPETDGLARRLLKQLSASEPPEIDDDAPEAFARLSEEVSLARGTAPVFVLDQFEDVFADRADEARRRIARLIEATTKLDSGIRWVLSYRHEAEWSVRQWFASDAAPSGSAAEGPRLSADAFHPLPLPPFGARKPERAFRAAIEKPLAAAGWQYREPDIDALVRLFAEARRAQPSAPLLPEFQVLLFELCDQSEGRRLASPDVPAEQLEAAVRRHIERVIDTQSGLFSDTRVGRAVLGILLHRLQEGGRRRLHGLRHHEAMALVGEPPGGRVIQALVGKQARLLMADRDPAGTGTRYRLSHDVVAHAVAAIGADGWSSEPDSGVRALIALDLHIVDLAHLYDRDRQNSAALHLSRRERSLVRRHEARLIRTPRRAAWWKAARRRRALRLLAGWSVAALTVAAGLGVFFFIEEARRQDALRAVQRLQADVRAGISVLPNLQQLIKAGDAPQEVDALIDDAPLDGVMDAANLGLERARARFICRQLEARGHAMSPGDFGRLIAGAELSAHPTTHGRLDDPAALHRDIRAVMIERFGQPPFPLDQAAEWVDLEGGKVTIGAPTVRLRKPRHTVTVAPFALARREVTLRDWAAFDPVGLVSILAVSGHMHHMVCNLDDWLELESDVAASGRWSMGPGGPVISRTVRHLGPHPDEIRRRLQSLRGWPAEPRSSPGKLFAALRTVITRALGVQPFGCSNRSHPEGNGLYRGFDLMDLPVWYITWYEAQAYALWSDPEGRLPTNAEWEYAIRGGTHAPDSPTAFWFHYSGASGYAASAELESPSDHLRHTDWFSRDPPRPVCSLPERVKPGDDWLWADIAPLRWDDASPSPFAPFIRPVIHPLRLCDMAGNVQEWVADRAAPYPEPQPPAYRALPYVVRGSLETPVRGGSSGHGAGHSGSANRAGTMPDRRLGRGMRVARGQAVRPRPVSEGSICDRLKRGDGIEE